MKQKNFLPIILNHEILRKIRPLVLKSTIITKDNLNSLSKSYDKFLQNDFSCELDTGLENINSRKQFEQGSFLKTLEKHLEKLSFETNEFDIYNPLYSSENNSLTESIKSNKSDDSCKEILNELNNPLKKESSQHILNLIQNLRKNTEPEKLQQFLKKNNNGQNTKNNNKTIEIKNNGINKEKIILDKNNDNLNKKEFYKQKTSPEIVDKKFMFSSYNGNIPIKNYMNEEVKNIIKKITKKEEHSEKPLLIKNQPIFCIRKKSENLSLKKKKDAGYIIPNSRGISSTKEKNSKSMNFSTKLKLISSNRKRDSNLQNKQKDSDCDSGESYGFWTNRSKNEHKIIIKKALLKSKSQEEDLIPIIRSFKPSFSLKTTQNPLKKH